MEAYIGRCSHLQNEKIFDVYSGPVGPQIDGKTYLPGGGTQITFKDPKTSWSNARPNEFNDFTFFLNSSSCIRESSSELFVSVFKETKIYRFYATSGELLAEYAIPENIGYRYRGINRNSNAKLGVSLLYVPVINGYGNEWGDVERYELLDGADALTEFLSIYR